MVAQAGQKAVGLLALAAQGRLIDEDDTRKTVNHPKVPPPPPPPPAQAPPARIVTASLSTRT
jgi:hypothetical protein